MAHDDDETDGTALASSRSVFLQPTPITRLERSARTQMVHLGADGTDPLPSGRRACPHDVMRSKQIGNSTLFGHPLIDDAAANAMRKPCRNVLENPSPKATCAQDKPRADVSCSTCCCATHAAPCAWPRNSFDVVPLLRRTLKSSCIWAFIEGTS